MDLLEAGLREVCVARLRSRAASVVAGVCRGRVAMWHVVPDGRWSGEAAAKVYCGPLSKALAKAWPGRCSWRVLEDSDPTGFKSKKGKMAKADAGIKPFAIPPCSPELSLCDCAFWQEVNRRTRRQESSWSKSRKESREDYLLRLKQTALRLPKAFLEKNFEDMRHRCQLLFQAKGHHFDEGH